MGGLTYTKIKSYPPCAYPINIQDKTLPTRKIIFPPGAKLFTLESVTMYTNVYTNKCMLAPAKVLKG